MPRAHDNGPFKEFDFFNWFCENLNDFQAEAKHTCESMRSESIRSHMRQAAKEQLLAVREMVDAAIEQIDKQEPRPKKA